MRRITAIAVLIVPALAAMMFWIGAADDLPQKAGPVTALIVPVGRLSRQGVARTEGIWISDPQKLAKLESFFPKYRQRPTSNIAGGWVAGYRVYFDFPEGRTVRVTVSENENAAHWTVGRGDFATHGDFNAFVEKL